MKHLRIIPIVCIFLSFMVSSANVAATSLDTTTTDTQQEYYLVYTDNLDDGLGANLYITSQFSTYGFVEIPGIGFFQNFTILADTITQVDLPLDAEVQGSDRIQNLGIHISANNAITVYLLNPGEPVYTNDAYHGLPIEDLGSEYIVMAYNDTISAQAFTGGYSELAIVSPYDDVSVTISPSASTGTRIAGEPYIIELNQNQVYTLQSDSVLEDLTGTIIQSSAPVAVFSGNRCVFIPSNYWACDHIVEQLLPTVSWGTNYISAPTMQSGGDIYRILAAENDTVVNVTGTFTIMSENPAISTHASNNPSIGFYSSSDIDRELDETLQATNQIYILDRAQFVEVLSTSPLVITSDKPTLVAQFALGQEYSYKPVGDPYMLIIPPVEQYLQKYTFVTPNGYSVNAVDVIIPGRATNTVLLDGTPVDVGLFQEIGESGYSWAYLPLSEGSHTIEADAAFSTQIFGFGSYVSYGYPGGLGSAVVNPPDPTDKTPIIIVPGLGGTSLINDQGELWLGIEKMVDDACAHYLRATNEYLNVLQLNSDGTLPLFPEDPHYTSVRAEGVLTTIHYDVDCIVNAEGDFQVYQPLVDYFIGQGYVLNEDLFLFGYDWRRDIGETAGLLDSLVNQVRGDGKVNIVAHSMGGLVSRNYILDPIHAAKVDNLVILGTPFLGAPYAFKGLFLGDDFDINEQAHDNGIPSFVRLLDPERIRIIARNWPGIYEILPSQRFFDFYENGYIDEDRDIDGDGIVGSELDYPQTISLLNSTLNGTLVNKAVSFHSSSFDGFTSGTNDVKVYLFVGLGQATPGQLRFWTEYRFFNLISIDHVSIIRLNGDGTVLQHSSDLIDIDTNLLGPATVYYVNEDHYGLSTNTDVLQQITRLFASITDPVNQNISLTPDAWPLEGDSVEVNSPVELHVYDALGNHLGPLGGDVEYEIPDADYVVLGHDQSAFLPTGITYTIVLIGTAEGDFDLRLRKIESDIIQTTILFKDIPVVTSATIRVSTDPTLGYTMEADYDSDGVVDELISPTAILDPAASLDYTPPETQIILEGDQDDLGFYSGPVTVTLSATDDLGGSGVATILFSLDGNLPEEYSGPFVVDSDSVTYIYAKAIDLAGNEEAPLAEVRLQPIRIFLPVLIR